MRILIVGLGFMGRALAKESVSRGWDTSVVTRAAKAAQALPPHVLEGLALHEGEAANAVAPLLEAEPDAVVIAAGGRFPEPSKAAPLEDCVETLSVLIPVCQAVSGASTRKPRILFLSSAGAIYGNVPGHRSEAEEPRPKSPYGVSRIAAEKYLEYYRLNAGLTTVTLRCSNIYGEVHPAGRGQGVVSAMVYCAQTGFPFTMFGDGTQERDLLHVHDFARATLDIACLQQPPNIINVGSGQGVSIRDALTIVEQVSGREVLVRHQEATTTDRGRVVADISLLQSLITYEPRPFAVGVGDMWARLSNSPTLEATGNVD